MVPIIILGGEAGSGKDTIGNYLAQNYNAITIGQADPMKRYVRDVFGFTDEQLWGPSEMRNAEVRFTPEQITAVWGRQGQCGSELMRQIVPVDKIEVAQERLTFWFKQVFEKLDLERKISPRYVLQQLGTNWGRYVSKDMWSLYAIKTAMSLLAGDMTYTREHGLSGAQGRTYDYVVITDGRFRNELLLVQAGGGTAFRIFRPTAKKLEGAAGAHASEAELGGIPKHFYTAVLKNTHDFEYLYSQMDEQMAVNYGDLRVLGDISQSFNL